MMFLECNFNELEISNVFFKLLTEIDNKIEFSLKKDNSNNIFNQIAAK